jgi:plastocyanin domain-containing protein
MMPEFEIIGWVLIGLGLIGLLVWWAVNEPPRGDGPKYTKGGK